MFVVTWNGGKEIKRGRTELKRGKRNKSPKVTCEKTVLPSAMYPHTKYELQFFIAKYDCLTKHHAAKDRGMINHNVELLFHLLLLVFSRNNRGLLNAGDKSESLDVIHKTIMHVYS